MIWTRVLVLAMAMLAPALPAQCPVPEHIVAVSAAAEREISIATQNMWRFSSKEMSPVQSQQRIKAWSRHIQSVLRYPHVIALQEVDSLSLLEALAQRIVDDGGPAYQSLLVEGNDVSGIDVAVMYRSPMEVAQVKPFFSTQRDGSSWLFSRPPLQVEFSKPFPFALLALHLRSGHGLDDVHRGPRVRQKREAQARMVRGWAQARVAEGRPLMLIGDLNSAPGSDDYAVPLGILDQPPLWSVWQAVTQEQRFSYIYRCQPQAIDHILLSPKLRSRLVRAEVSRGNAGRYGLLNGSRGTAEVVSDHDALLVYLSY
ncbi:endonuclease/exonuclease/phosphatase family protein [Alcanivorax sp. 1008]|uniref:endonuclease/exonuclease/phosphatase family protein n=1 Tax=Alcanivorax sp. 1008 TaxID=2816853 RepID=UPI001D86A40E|nr:endonuclease/exonuclease/phosphatase family protein [Alcanivorax sp. 1008]MCC1496528.1 endonuclease/exonuclease/phosphatase family protein [Alcanivorax sp. 1008]